jgi:hypothetical protein
MIQLPSQAVSAKFFEFCRTPPSKRQKGWFRIGTENADFM